MIGRLEVHPTADELCAHVADWLIGRVDAAAAPVRVCLSGGSTPKQLFGVLARPDYAARMAWGKLQLFWGDERFVPHDSPQSNYGEAKRLLLDRVPIGPDQVHPFAADGTANEAAARYACVLQAAYGRAALDPARPLFEVNFLGLGDDGHTASLIPGQPVLQEREKWVAVVGEGRPEVRLTLTYPALQSARTVAFLVTGAAKAEILRGLRDGSADVPAARLRPVGETIWFVDAAAAA